MTFKKEEHDMEKRKRNLAIDFWRLIFVALIVLTHTVFLASKGESSPFRGGYIAVEFFFVVSGFLMTESAGRVREAEDGEMTDTGSMVFSIMKRKIKGIMPDLLLACAVAFAVRQFVSKPTAGEILKNAAESVYVPLLMDATRVRHYAVLGQVWYISAMMIVMPFFLYFLLKKENGFFKKAAVPVMYAMLMGILSMYAGNLNVTGKLGKTGFPYGALLRAMMGLAGGVMSHSIAESLKKTEFTGLGTFLITLAETGGYIAVIVLSAHFDRSQFDFLLAMVFIISVGITFSGQSSTCEFLNDILSKLRITKLGRYTLNVYLYNNIFHYIDWKLPMKELMPYYLIYSFIFPFIGMFVTDLLRKLFVKAGRLIRK